MSDHALLRSFNLLGIGVDVNDIMQRWLQPWKVPDHRCDARMHPLGSLGARNCRPENVYRAAVHRGSEYQERIGFAARRVPYAVFLICFSTKFCLLLVGPRSASVLITMMNTRKLENTMRAVGSLDDSKTKVLWLDQANAACMEAAQRRFRKRDTTMPRNIDATGVLEAELQGDYYGRPGNSIWL